MPVGLDTETIHPDDETFVFSPVDPVIRYPSYKCFDEFIDVERLRSLDGYIKKRIRRHMTEHDDDRFYTGPYRLEGTSSPRPGSRMIYLSESSEPYSYFDLDRTEMWHPADGATEFALLMDFIATLPFDSTGRMLIMYDDPPSEIPAHRDHIDTEVLHEFIWMRTNRSKPFYFLNYESGEREYIEGFSCWFDSVNQFHGCDGGESLSFSIRVDGLFTDEFRAAVPRPPINPASTPSFWVCSSTAERTQ